MERADKKSNLAETTTTQPDTLVGSSRFRDERTVSRPQATLRSTMQASKKEPDNNQTSQYRPSRSGLASSKTPEAIQATTDTHQLTPSPVLQRNTLKKIGQGALAVVLPPVAFHVWGWSEYKNTVALYDNIIAQSQADAAGINSRKQYAERAKKWEHVKVGMSGFAAWAALAALALAGISLFPAGAWAAVPSAIAGIFAGVAQALVGLIEKQILPCDQKLKNRLGETEFADAMVAKVHKQKTTWWLNVVGGLAGAVAGGAGFLGLSPAASGAVLGGERAVAAIYETGSTYQDEAAALEVGRRHEEQRAVNDQARENQQANRNRILRPLEQRPLAEIMTQGITQHMRISLLRPNILQRQEADSPTSNVANSTTTSDAPDILMFIKQQAKTELQQTANRIVVLQDVQQSMKNLKGYLGNLRGSTDSFTDELSASEAKLDAAKTSLHQGLANEQSAVLNQSDNASKAHSKEEEANAFNTRSSKVDSVMDKMKEAHNALELTAPDMESKVTPGILSQVGSFIGKRLTSFRKFMRSAWRGLSRRLNQLGQAGSMILAAMKSRINSIIVKVMGLEKEIDPFEADLDDGISMTETSIETQKENQDLLKKL